jgi:predicted GTPase
MGQTGAGKTSLINALFGTSYETSAVWPTTKEVRLHVERVSGGGEFHFYDMPGLGEASDKAKGRIAEYRDLLIKADVALWTIHADSKSVTFEQDALSQILGDEEPRRSQLWNKITFVLTKIDVLIPAPWIFSVTRGDRGLFAPNEKLAEILRQKADYFTQNLLEPYADRVVAVTHNDTGLQPDRRDRHLVASGRAISHTGRLSGEMLDAYSRRYPEHREIFRRLHDHHRVVACSARFRFGLTTLMEVIVNKLGPYAVGRFENFTIGSDLDEMNLATVKAYCNLTILDGSRNEYLFSLGHNILRFGEGGSS